MSRKLTEEEKRVTEIVRLRMKESQSSEFLVSRWRVFMTGRAIFRLEVRDAAISKSMASSMGDTGCACGYRCGDRRLHGVPRGVELATLEFKINYLEPVPGGTIKADARVLRGWPKLHSHGM